MSELLNDCMNRLNKVNKTRSFTFQHIILKISKELLYNILF